MKENHKNPNCKCNPCTCKPVCTCGSDEHAKKKTEKKVASSHKTKE